MIGSELHDPSIRGCAVVTAPLAALEPVSGLGGGLGVIGPVRMRYDRVIPAVRGLSERVAGYIA